MTAAAPWEMTGSFSKTPSETATSLRQQLKMVCVFTQVCCFQSFQYGPVNYRSVFNRPLTFVFVEDTADGPCPYSGTASATLPPFVCPLLLTGSRPHTDSRPMTATGPGVLSPPGSRPASADSDLATIVAESSILTHG